MGYCILRVVKRFLSSNVIIMTVNNKEVKKLYNNTHLVNKVEDNIRIVIYLAYYNY